LLRPRVEARTTRAQTAAMRRNTGTESEILSNETCIMTQVCVRHHVSY